MSLKITDIILWEMAPLTIAIKNIRNYASEYDNMNGMY